MDLRLMELRKKAGYRSRDEFAQVLGVNKYTYKTWETSTVMMSLRQAHDVAVALGVTLNDLVGMTSPYSGSGAQAGGYSRVSESLSPDERALISDYRLSDDRGRRRISNTARTERLEAFGGEDASPLSPPHPRPRRAA